MSPISIMSQVRLLSVDFDGTLIRSWAAPPFPKKLVQTLDRLRCHGVMIAFNTGRSIHLVEDALGETGFPIRPDFALTCEREVFRWNGSAWEDFGEWNIRCREEHALLFAQTEPLLTEIGDYVESTTAARLHYEEGRFAGVISTTNTEMDIICKYIDAKSAGVPEFGYQRNSIYLRLCHSAYHKGAALAELQRLTGITPDETFAAGDNFNDLPMLDLSYARYLACPSNALEEVKQVVRAQGGFVASNDSGVGVCEALTHFFPKLYL
jgi:hydroxymethylpyrimidine pyrophosphatase-like HAD family hydrolase